VPGKNVIMPKVDNFVWAINFTHFKPKSLQRILTCSEDFVALFPTNNFSNTANN